MPGTHIGHGQLSRLLVRSKVVLALTAMAPLIICDSTGKAGKTIMANDLDQLRRTAPDLVRVDPRETDVQAWFDQVYEAVKQVDEVEGVILRVHQGYLSDPAKKIAAAAELMEALDRAARISAILHQARLPRRLSAA